MNIRTARAITFVGLRGRYGVYLTASVAILIFALILRVVILDRNYQQGWDEGAYLISARLIAAGFQPYTQLYMPQLPLFLYTLAWAQNYIGDTVVAGRIVVAGYSLLGLAAAAGSARLLSNRFAALAVAFMLAINPGYFVYSRAVYLEVPATAFAMLALWGSLRFTRGGNRIWLLLAGLLWAWSVLVKPFYLGFGLTLAGYVLLYRWHQTSLPSMSGKLRLLIVDLLVLGGAALLPVIHFLVTNDVAAFYEQFILVNVRLIPDGFADLIRVINFLGRDWGMLALALFGVVAGWRRLAINSTAPLALGIVGMLVLVLRVPHFNHHDVVLIPPIAVLAGVGIGSLLDALPSLLNQSRSALFTRRNALALLGIAALVVYLANFPRIALFDFRILQIPVLTQTLACVDTIQRETAPGAFVVSDQPMMVYRAGRLIPPEVAIASGADIEAGGVTEEALIKAASEHHSNLIVLSRHSNFLDGWTAWIEAHYDKVADCGDSEDDDTVLYRIR